MGEHDSQRENGVVATTDSETLQRLVASRYYDNRLDFETVERLVGATEARRLQLLKTTLEREPLDLASPTAVDIYDGDVTTVDPEGSDD